MAYILFGLKGLFMQGNLLSGQNLSQEDKVLKYLIENGFINSIICREKLGNFQLPYIIRSLIKKGIAIFKLQTIAATDKGKRYCVNYYLAPYERQNDITKKLIAGYQRYAKRA